MALAQPTSRRSHVPAIVLAVGAAGVLFGILAAVRNSAESTIAGIAGALPLGWAFVAGVVIGATGQRIVGAFPYAGVIVGIALTALGVWLLIPHRPVGIAAASRLAVTPRRGLTNVFLFGIAYAVGSLSCTLPIFLLVAGSALSAGSPAASVVQFVSSGLGMGRC